MQKPNGKRRVVWQDVMPAKAPVKPIIIDTPAPKKSKFKLSLPKLPKYNLLNAIKLKLAIIPKRFKIITTLIIVIALALGGYYIYISRPTQVANNTDNEKTDITQVLKQGTPEYQTVSPTNKKINDLGGWTRISPNNTDPVYAYADKIGDVTINVSQQPLPETFKINTEQQIENLSQGTNALEKIAVGNIIVHIGTSAKGQQSVIFTENGLLILIKSNAPIASDQWIKYINSLQ